MNILATEWTINDLDGNYIITIERDQKLKVTTKCGCSIVGELAEVDEVNREIELRTELDEDNNISIPFSTVTNVEKAR